MEERFHDMTSIMGAKKFQPLEQDHRSSTLHRSLTALIPTSSPLADLVRAATWQRRHHSHSPRDGYYVEARSTHRRNETSGFVLTAAQLLFPHLPSRDNDD